MSQKVYYNLWLYKSKSNKRSEAPIYLRITVDGKRTEISTGIIIQIHKWNNKKELIRGNSEDVIILNRRLRKLKSDISNLIDNISQKDIVITPELLKVKLMGKDKVNSTLMDVIDSHIMLLKSKVGIELSTVPYKKLQIVKNRIDEFLNCHYSRRDIGLNELNYKFIEDFDTFLKVKKNYSLNSASAACQRLKRVIKYAISNKLLITDPFIAFHCKKVDVKKEFLTKDELIILANSVIENIRLQEVKDVFVFCCLTGLSYSDVAKLSPNDIIIDDNGNTYIKINRVKTNVSAIIPLNEFALKIIESYKGNFKASYNKTLLPVISNQKTNAYLKEIANIVGINKNLTHHIARHTFANYCSESGISMEVTSKMLGHSSIKTTAIYYKVSINKVMNESKILINDFIKLN